MPGLFQTSTSKESLVDYTCDYTNTKGPRGARHIFQSSATVIPTSTNSWNLGCHTRCLDSRSRRTKVATPDLRGHGRVASVWRRKLNNLQNEKQGYHLSGTSSDHASPNLHQAKGQVLPFTSPLLFAAVAWIGRDELTWQIKKPRVSKMKQPNPCNTTSKSRGVSFNNFPLLLICSSAKVIQHIGNSTVMKSFQE